jgi:hypothetical protein
MVVHRSGNFDFDVLFHSQILILAPSSHLLWAVPSYKAPLESTKRHRNQRFFGWYAARCSTINKWLQIVIIRADRDVLHSGAVHADKYARPAN